jgi:hypothetical protein
MVEGAITDQSTIASSTPEKFVGIEAQLADAAVIVIKGLADE